MRHHPKVVADQEHRGILLLAQVAQHVEDASLHGDVQRRRGLVGEDELGLARQGQRGHGALTHPARELMRVVGGSLRRVRNADPPEQIGGCRGELTAGPAVATGDLGDLSADRLTRVQAGQGVLEDHRDLASADPATTTWAGGQQILRAPPQLTPGECTLRQQTDDGHRRHGLAAAGLADQAGGPARMDGERHLVDDPYRPRRPRKDDIEVPDVQQRRVRAVGSRSARARRSRVVRARRVAAHACWSRSTSRLLRGRLRSFLAAPTASLARRVAAHVRLPP